MEAKNGTGNYSGNVIRELKYDPPMPADLKEIYEKFARRVLWIDGNLVPGAFR
jgi:hypothetical protein